MNDSLSHSLKYVKHGHISCISIFAIRPDEWIELRFREIHARDYPTMERAVTVQQIIDDDAI